MSWEQDAKRLFDLGFSTYEIADMLGLEQKTVWAEVTEAGQAWKKKIRGDEFRLKNREYMRNYRLQRKLLS